MIAASASLSEWLLARIAEDEAVARAAIVEAAEWWVDGPAQQSGKHWVYATGEKFDSLDIAAHIIRHDPARVLAQCAAHRAIVEEARGYSPELEHGDNGEWAFDAVLHHLAQVYRGAPGWREEWAQ